MRLLAIDPGRDTGWAAFNESVLVGCGLGTPPFVPMDRVVIEKPCFYKGRTAKNADPNDLITLAIMVGKYTERAFNKGAASVSLVLPNEWKGQLDKDTCALRVVEVLDHDERVLVTSSLIKVAKKIRHNVLDAIGIGLFAVGRKF